MSKLKEQPCLTETSLYENVALQAKKTPQEIAFRYFGKAFTYRHLLKRIHQFALALKAKGVKQGDPVTICLPNIPEAIYLLYAVDSLGAVANIVHPKYSLEQLKETIDETGSKHIFVLDSRFKELGSLNINGATLYCFCPMKELSSIKRYIYRGSNMLWPYQNTKMFYRGKASTFEPIKRDPHEDAIYLHSGGTSGKAKTIALCTAGINSVVTNVYWITGLDNCYGKGILAALPMFHGFGLTMCIHAFLCHGGTLILMPKFSAKETVRYIKKNQLHYLLGVPTLYEALLHRKNFKGRKLSNLLESYVGGDYVSPSLTERFDKRMEDAGSVCRLREGYGLTEAVNVCSVNTPTHHKASSVGHLLPNIKAVILDENLNELPPYENGEICIGGPTVMNGYRFENKDKNDNVFYIGKDGTKYVRTGDFGCLDENNFLMFRSRIKQLIKVNGVPVFPSMVEDSIMSLEFIYETCAISVDDERFGHLIKVFVVLSKQFEGTLEEAREKISDRIVSRLGVYSKPKEIVFIDSMPHTQLGKIDYKLLQ